MAIWVNGRKVEYGSPEWARGDALAGMVGPQAAAGMGFPNATAARGAFVPWQAPPIPSGYYDPALDAQRQSASRGLVNAEQDLGLAGRRAQEDYGLEVGDVERGYARGMEDVGTQRAYTEADYQHSVNMLNRQFGQLARQQGEQARKYGITSGGIAMLQAGKRAENQGIAQFELDTSRNRALAGFDTAGRRLGEDRTSSLGRLQTAFDRGVADRGTALSRARSEDLFYGLDVDAQKAFQAGQAGYIAPARPANEFVRPDGSVERVVKRDGWVYTYDPSGKIVNKRRAA